MLILLVFSYLYTLLQANMEYAIVDIETTGGYAAHSGITEIAIIIHDGQSVIDRYETLINPMRPIPVYIQALTGISNEMVWGSPIFSEVAPQIHALLQGRIFVAHNVNFDYSFLKHHLELTGYTFTAKKLCTVRLSRKIKPGFPSYSLGKLCDALQISLHNRHRAAGDAAATAVLFSRLLEWDTEGHIPEMLKKSSKEQQLPPNLPKEDFEALPSCPGVYYFMDQGGKVIYIGKAINIKKRVASHFVGHNPKPQRQHFLRSIYSISFERCGTELIALLLEAAEIKKHWPTFNRAMKEKEAKFALYSYEDHNGYLRLALGNHRKNLPHLYLFNRQSEGMNLLHELIYDYGLHPKLCGLSPLKETKVTENPAEYNRLVENALEHLSKQLPSFVILDKGRHEEEKSIIWVEKGCLYGMGYIDQSSDITSVEEVKESIPRYASNYYMMELITNFAAKYPWKVKPVPPFATPL